MDDLPLKNENAQKLNKAMREGKNTFFTDVFYVVKDLDGNVEFSVPQTLVNDKKLDKPIENYLEDYGKIRHF